METQPFTMNFDRKCRICAADILDITCGIPIFSGIFLDEKIKKYLYITVSEDDELPKAICATCFIKIESIDKFAYMATKTEETFLAWLKRAKEQNIPLSSSRGLFIKDENSVDNQQSISRHQLILKTYRNPRNPRHVDHITLEQIINDQIVRNPKVLYRPTPLPGPPLDPGGGIAYQDLMLGQLIKDEELLKLILKALKWVDETRRSRFDYWLKKLKGTRFHDVLSNPNLLNDSDLMQLIKSYVGQDALTLFNNNEAFMPPHITIIPAQGEASGGMGPGEFKLEDDESVQEMEVGVDPDLFLPYEDEASGEKTEEKQEVVEIMKVETAHPTVPLILPGHSDIRNNGKFLCTMCDDTFVSNTDLQNHVMTHLIRRKRKEEYAPATEVTVVQTSRRGRRPKSDNQARFACAICKKRLSTKGNLKVHMNTHRPRSQFQCNRCQRVFRSGKNLAKHKQCHSGDEEFICNVCRRVYPSQSTLNAHAVSHSNDRKFSCSVCEKTFKRNQDLKFHLNQHNGIKPYKCLYCDRAFASSGNCFSHRKRMHPEELAKEKQKRTEESAKIA